MVLGIVLALIAVLGIILGVKWKRKLLIIASGLILILIISVWGYFYSNPY